MAKIDFKKIDTYRKSFDGILQVKKHVSSEDDLPVTGAQNGDIYTVGDSDTLYMFNNGEWGTLGSGGSTDWNNITNKPFYTKTFPSIDLPNGIKLVIDGYVKDGAQVDEQYGRYSVTDTRFDVTLINGSDNTILEKLVGVIPEIGSQTTSRRNMVADVLFDNVHMANGDDIEGALMLNMSWSELAAFNEVVRSWDGEIYFFESGSGLMIGSSFNVLTPAKPSAVKGQDYDTVTIEDSLDGYTAYYKKPDEVKKIDNKYLPGAMVVYGRYELNDETENTEFVPNDGQPTFTEAVEAFENGIPVTLVRLGKFTRKSSNVLCYDNDVEMESLIAYIGDGYVYWINSESHDPEPDPEPNPVQ